MLCLSGGSKGTPLQIPACPLMLAAGTIHRLLTSRIGAHAPCLSSDCRRCHTYFRTTYQAFLQLAALETVVLQEWGAGSLFEVVPLDVPEMAEQVGIPVIHSSAPYQRQHSALVIWERSLHCLCCARAKEQLQVQCAALVHPQCLHRLFDHRPQTIIKIPCTCKVVEALWHKVECIYMLADA